MSVDAMFALGACQTNDELNETIVRLKLVFLPKLTKVFRTRATLYFEPLTEGDKVNGMSLPKEILYAKGKIKE